MAGGLIFLIGFIALALGLGGWFVVPKGNNQVFVRRRPDSRADRSSVIRTSLLLLLSCCYLM